MKYLKTAGMKKYAKAMGNVCSALSIVYVLAALINTDPSVFQGLDWRLCLPVCAAGVALKSITVWMSARAWCLLRAKTVQPQRSVPRVCQGKYRKIPSG